MANQKLLRRLREAGRKLRYSRSSSPVHPLVRGHRIERVLRHLATEEGGYPDVRELSAHVLRDGDTSALWSLHDALHEVGHPLASRYNWLAAATKLHLDHTVWELMHEHAARHHPDPAGLPGRQAGLRSAIDDHRFHLTLPDWVSPLQESHRDAGGNVKRLLADNPHLTPELVLESLDRLHTRWADRHHQTHFPDEPIYSEGELDRQALSAHEEEAPFFNPTRERELRATRFKRITPRNTAVGEAFNEEFRKLADRLGPPDLEKFKGQNHFGYLVTAAKGDEDLAHDMATHLLYGPRGEGSPLEKNYDRSRPLWHRFAGVANVLPTKLRQRDRESRSPKFRGNFTSTRLNSDRLRSTAPAPDGGEVPDTGSEQLLAETKPLVKGVLRRGADPGTLASRLGVSVGSLEAAIGRFRANQKVREGAIKRESRGKRAGEIAGGGELHGLVASVVDQAGSLDLRELKKRLRSRGFTAGVGNTAIDTMIADGRLVTGSEKRPKGKVATTVKLGPNVKYARPKSSSFLEALRRVRSSQQKSLHQIASYIHESLGLTPASVRDAILDGPTTAVSNTAQALFHDSDPDTVRYAAAFYGLLSQTPQLMVFHVHPDGPDSVYKASVEATGDEIRKSLDAHGITHRVLLPAEKGFAVLVADRGRKLAQAISKFAGEHGVEVSESRGTAELLGDSTEGAKASGDSRADYRAVVEAYEKGKGK